MRRLFVTVMFAVSFSFALPAPAHAWWHWLDELSGPGPFSVVDLQWRIKCFDQPSQAGGPPPLDISLGQIKSERLRKVARVVGSGCVFDPDPFKNPRSSINLRAGYGWSVGKDLADNGVAWPKVSITSIEPGYSIFVDRAKSLELAAGAGVMFYTGSFDTLQRFYARALVTYYVPGATGLGVLAGVQYTPKGFTAKDFGGTSSFHTDHEAQWFLGATIDLARLRH